MKYSCFSGWLVVLLILMPLLSTAFSDSDDEFDDILRLFLSNDWSNLHQTPFDSGESIRIRSRNSYINSGRLEVYRAHQWGYVCANGWDLRDADVACKQLGFPTGAISVAVTDESLHESQWPSAKILMNNVRCTGTEKFLHECQYSPRTDCAVKNVATLTCHANEGCPEGWVSGFDKCYKFYSTATTIKLAATVCARNNASLLTIDSIEENHFLSSIIKNSMPDIHQWYTGGQKKAHRWEWNRLIFTPHSRYTNLKRRNRQRYSSFKILKSAVTFDKWFPGWFLHNKEHAEPQSVKSYDCLTLSDQFENPNNEITLVDYFYWKADKCRNNEGIHFICQMDAKTKKEKNIPDCYTDNGSTYMGTAAVTEKDNICLSWAGSSTINERTHPGKGLGNHNYCRNPDKDARPWCWVSHVNRQFGFCKLSKCFDLSTTKPTTKLNRDTPNCYTDNGSTYMGTTAVTENDNVCLSWTESSIINERTHPGKGLGNHNYCRNPDNDVRPWCWISHVNHLFEFCKLSKCSDLSTTEPTAKFTTNTPSLSPSTCSATQFYCTKQRTCIPESFHCDNEENCLQGEDEVDCVYTLDDFTQTAHAVLRLSHNSGPYASESYSGVSNEMCAKKCVESTEFVCRSFVYDARRRSCDLSTFNSLNNMRIIPSLLYDYYELKPQDIEVQLIGGDEHSGTVEVTYRGKKGVICDDEWSLQDATVICRMLGYRAAEQATTLNYFGYPANNVNFLLDDVNCTGDETSIKNCNKKSWNDHDCNSFEIAGVVCQISKEGLCDEDQLKCKNDLCVSASEVCNKHDDCGDNSDELDCQSVHIQLVNGHVSWEGRVEVTRNGLRGTICDDQWDDGDAAVVCRSLGFLYGGKAVHESYFGAGHGPIWLDNVQCKATAVLLEECFHRGWAIHDCDHTEDAGVKCFHAPPQPPATDRATITPMVTTVGNKLISVKLIGGDSDNEGNVEVLIHNVKYRVCDDLWDNNDATVICRMLGFSAGGIATTKSHFGSENVDIIFNKMHCNGTETDISQCPAVLGAEKHKCGPSNLAGVICNNIHLVQINESSFIEDYSKCGIRPYDYEEFTSTYTENHSPNTSLKSENNKADQIDSRSINYRYEDKIVGGTFAVHGAYPWQVRVEHILSTNSDGKIFGIHHCGGTIISEYWILSAAHCFLNKRKSEFQLLVGEHHLNTKDMGEQSFNVEEIISHELYDDATKDYDIALLKIRPTSDGRGIIFNSYVQPACLPDASVPYIAGTTCMTSGWGNANAKVGEYPKVLKALKIPILSHDQCEYLYTKRTRGFYTDRMICAGSTSGGVDTCDGDSGGPLVCKVDGVYTILGITSWGRGCAMPNLPGVYTRVSVFVPWINDHIKSHSENEKERIIPNKP